MDDLKIIVANNLIKLRTEARITQAELGEKLRYSDKTVSKWERAEALPDANVLKNLAEIFDVSVDYLLNNHSETQPVRRQEILQERSYNPSMIVLVSITGIWTLAVLLFVIFWILGHKFWIIFAATVPVSLITLLVLNAVWNKGKGNAVIVALLVFSIIAFLYCLLYTYDPWQLFFVLIPAELIVYLSFRIRKKNRSHR